MSAHSAPDNPRVTVVIPAYGRPERVSLAVRSLFEQTLPPDQFEVIVVDSSGDERVVSAIRELQDTAPFPLACYVKEAEGPGPSRNLGAWRGRGEFIAFMDYDCLARPRWLEEALAHFRDGVGIVLGRTIPEPGAKLGVLRHYVSVESETFLYEAANVFYRRRAFEEAGGFAHDLHPRSHRPVGGEDADLAWRVKGLGWGSCFAPGALVHHEVRRMPLHRWFIHKDFLIWPRLVREHPELRRFLFCRYFFDANQAALLAGLLGSILCWLTPLALLLWIPYVALLVSQPTRTLKGPLRLLRPVFYLPRDLIIMAMLLTSSVRWRSVLL